MTMGASGYVQIRALVKGRREWNLLDVGDN